MEENEVKSILRQRVAILRGNMSLKEFSEKSGVNWKTLVNIEKEVHYPSMQVLLQFKKAFGVDVGWLIGETNRYHGFSADDRRAIGIHPVCIDNLEKVASREGIEGVHTIDNPLYCDDFYPERYRSKEDLVVRRSLTKIRKACPEKYKELLQEINENKDFVSFFEEGEANLDQFMEYEIRTVSLMLYNWNFITAVGAYFRSVSTDGPVSLDPPYSMTDRCTLDRIIQYLKAMRRLAVDEWPELQSRFSKKDVARILEIARSLEECDNQEED